MKRVVEVGVTTSALLVMAACSTPVSSQTPLASSGPATPTSSKLTAPQVPNPLNVSKFEQEPCSVLSQAQATQVANLTSSSKSEGNVAPICIWMDTDHNRVTMGFIPGNGGLATSYKNQDNKYGYFAVAPDIGGYPAAFVGPHDDRNAGACLVAVGVSNDEVITVSVSFRDFSPNYATPCPMAVKAAEAAMTTIKAGV